MTVREMIESLAVLDQASNFCFTSLGADSRLAHELDRVRGLIAMDLDQIVEEKEDE